ncbi:MAG: hypothetical protein LC733_13605 [Actinobacteria bacterium]|nr:hypothetical protein [Actinomycetota bacterium]
MSLPERGDELSSGDDVRLVLASFAEAFPFASVDRVQLKAQDGAVTNWVGDDSSLPAWFQTNQQLFDGAIGFEADVSIEIDWVDGANSGQAVFPQGGYLLFERQASVATLTLWPNLFTDVVRLYDKAPGGNLISRLVPFAPASAQNRSRLRRSLRRWETLTEGTISEWDSELVEGVQRYGFADDATPL